MKGQMFFGLVALLEVLVSVLAADNQTYVAIGDTLSLMPPKPSSGPINNIVWKCNGNLVLEWVEGKVDLEFYGTFKGRSKLDTTNAHLEVKNMTKDDSGFYSAEINNQVQNDRYDVKVIRAVPVPEVTTRPLTCGTGSDKDKCSLACNGLEYITEAEPITYSWKSDVRELQVNTPNLSITNDEETRRVKTYSCKMKNPISEKESKAHDNPFFKEEPEPKTGLIVGMVFLVLVLVSLIVLAVVKHDSIREWLHKQLQTDKSDTPEENPLRKSKRPMDKKTAPNSPTQGNPAENEKVEED